MNVTLDAARHDELTRQAQGLTVRLPTAHLTSTWTDEMSQLNKCVQPDDLLSQLSRTGGWAAALLHAGVIDGDLYNAMNTERHMVFERVRQRLGAEQ